VSGVIEKIGSTVVGVSVGQKVTTRYVWGALAEYIVCKPFNVKVLPESFPMLEISLIEVRARRRSGARSGKSGAALA